MLAVPELAVVAGRWLGAAAVVALCAGGLLLSCLSFSGTWLVVAAAALAAALRAHPFPGWWTVAVFALLAAAVEGLEMAAGAWGVRRRGGSPLAGFMALVGGLAGLMVGGLIPVPVVGPLIGMMAGSFWLVYLVERRRLQHAERAAAIAWGAVAARALTILVKVTVTLGMAGYLLIGLLLTR